MDLDDEEEDTNKKRKVEEPTQPPHSTLDCTNDNASQRNFSPANREAPN